jgi:hypothetical protein
MKIRQILIAVFVSYLVSLNAVADTSIKFAGRSYNPTVIKPAGKTYNPNVFKFAGQTYNRFVNRLWKGKIYSLMGKKWHLHWRFATPKSTLAKITPPVAPKASTIASSLPGLMASPSNRDQDSKAPTTHGGQGSNTLTITKAPEISAASGASALAFLSGIMLLVGERTRKRKI